MPSEYDGLHSNAENKEEETTIDTFTGEKYVHAPQYNPDRLRKVGGALLRSLTDWCDSFRTRQLSAA